MADDALTRKDADVDRLTLLPCPFCGGEAELRKRYSALEGEPKHYVRCSSGKCGARYVPDGFPVDEWNRRQSLSQEAVRDEALEVPLKPDIGWLRKVAALCPNLDGTEDMVGVVRGVHGAILATALKREPNAAGRATGREQSHAAGDGQPAASSAAPAPAAPDVASMMKRLNEALPRLTDVTLSAYAKHRTHLHECLPLLRDAAALLAKLGQGGGFTPDPTIELIVDKLCKPDRNETKY